MSPTIRLESDLLSAVELNGAGDAPRYSHLTGKKRQDLDSPPSFPSDSGSLTQNTPLPSLPCVSTPFTVPISTPSPSYSSIPSTSSAVSNPSSPSSSNAPSVSDNSNQSSSEHTKALVFSLIGGILALLLFGYLAFWLTRRYQRKYQKRVLYESFWEKWNWGTYSPVDGDATMPTNYGSSPSGEGAQLGGKMSSGPDRSVTRYTWWQKFHFNPVPEAASGDGAKKKSRSGTVYKVKSWKPGEDFDIDSCAPSNIVDL
ncbi:hypothetical protein NP233_g1247 [Leucocoprinus birnbaumii]|uniref:Uncharacterized protein n=1 Tax=Leucocoprinus birnbaumii TaxID=56174 RepID=A0AAD5W1C1_9AGAR|nr:hypothetical protein NP233_g1247 [Leucocoprinus birnbaumii]